MAVVRSAMARMLPDMSDGEMERVISKALELTEKDTYQAMEALVHNLNTMHSRAGAQIPFTPSITARIPAPRAHGDP